MDSENLFPFGCPITTMTVVHVEIMQIVQSISQFQSFSFLSSTFANDVTTHFALLFPNFQSALILKSSEMKKEQRGNESQGTGK
jgi:hypothetical protein